MGRFRAFYTPTGQICSHFGFDQTLQVGTTIHLGLQNWEIRAAGEHDPHAVVFFEPVSRILISADALWQNGFGVMFPELEGIDAFNEVAATLDLIECLNPDVVVLGHGAVFKYQPEILAVARQKLDGFIRDPVKLAWHGAKVLFKFKLLEKRKLLFSEFLKWAANTSYLVEYHHRFFAGSEFLVWISKMCIELVKAGVATRHGDFIFNRRAPDTYQKVRAKSTQITAN